MIAGIIVKALCIFLLFCSTSYAGGKIVYLVRWTNAMLVSVPCPDQSKPDEYGRSSFSYGCCVNHMKIYKTRKEKKFSTEEEADKFIKNMPLVGQSVVGSSWCESPKKIRILKTEKSNDEARRNK